MHGRSDLAWCTIGETVIFLDLAADRYFRLPEVAHREWLERLAQAREPLWRQPCAFPRPADWVDAVRLSPAMTDGPVRPHELARAVWAQWRMERTLATRSLMSVMLDLRRASEAVAARAIDHRVDPAPVVRAFERARLVRTAADRCLPRSIALARCLLRRGAPARLVIGVKLAPFAAHCWVQRGDQVLNDSVEEVWRYTPILVV